MRIEKPSRHGRTQAKTRCNVSGFGLIACLVVSSTCIRPTLATPRAVDTPVNQFTMTPNQGTRGKTSRVVVRSLKCDQIKLTGATLNAPDSGGIEVNAGDTIENGCAITASISIKPDASYGPIILQLRRDSVLLGTVTFTVSPPQYLMIPGRGVPGKEYDVTVSSSDCAQNSLKGALLATPQGSGINVSKINSNLEQGCSLTAKISIEPDAPYGDVVFRLTDAKGEIFGLVPFSVISKPPEPIPPGIDPQIDVMWAVVPWKIVADNFGRRIAKLYYCIEVIIGNNSGYSLQIVSTGFTIPGLAQQFQAQGLKKPTIPSNGYKTTRGSIEWEQNQGWRNLTVNLIKGVGPVLTGITPFFHAVNHRANFSEGVNILSNPFEKGFEMVFPDKTIRNLERLDDQILRDGLIINNNLQVKTKVFMPKDMVGLSDSDRDNPHKAMLALGELVIVGDRIQHINRVKVTSSNEGGPVPVPATIVQTAQSVKQGEEKVLHYSGVGLEKLIVDKTDSLGVSAEQPIPDEGGHGFSIKVKVENDAKPGTHFLNIKAIQGDSTKTIPISIEVEAATPEVTVEGITGVIATADPAGQDVPITLKGKFLKGAALVFDPNPDDKLTIKDLDNSKNELLTAKIHVPANFSGKTTLKVKNGDKVTETPFEVKPQGQPQGSLTVTEPGSNVARLKKATRFKIKITGSNLKGARLRAIGSAKEEGADVEDVKSRDSDTEITATITGHKDFPPFDAYKLEVENATGKIELRFAINSQPAPVITPPTKLQPDSAPKPGEARSITINGDNLDGASLEQVADPDGALEISNLETTKDQISARITVPATAKAKTYQLEVKNTGKKVTLSFEVKAPNQ